MYSAEQMLKWAESIKEAAKRTQITDDLNEPYLTHIAEMLRQAAEQARDAQALIEFADIVAKTINDAPGLPLINRPPEELNQWTDAIVTILKNVGLYEQWKLQRTAIAKEG